MLLDFGVAHYGAGTATTALTLAGSLVGTPAYMAPEQAGAASSLTPAADIYALGVVAYDCLAGNRQLPVQHAVAALGQLRLASVPPLEQVCPQVPSPLAGLVARMLARDPAQRPSDGAALRRELQALGPLEAGAPAGGARPAPPVPPPPLSLHSQALLTSESSSSSSSETARPVLGTRPPCLGREQELTILEAILAHSQLESQSQAVLITAPKGLGKTRLRQEFALRAQRCSRPPVVLLGVGQRMSAGAPYALLGQGLRRLCGIVTTADPPAAYHCLSRRCTELLGARAGARAAQFLSKLCALHLPEAALPELRAALGDSKLMARHLLWALAEFLRAFCGRTPLLWVLDDLQWGDALSISLLGGVVRALGDYPLTVLALGRPEVKLAFPALRHWPNLKEWTLRGLSRAASERLVHFVLGDKAAPSTVARIAQQAEGSPLLLEELLRAPGEAGP